jgi:hypothetical protein
MRNRSGNNPSFLPSPGWLFLIAGLAILGSAVVIPAAEALDEARYARDRALVSEQFRLDRISRYRAVIAALDDRDPAFIEHLRAIQLNQYPEGMRPLGEITEDPALASASIFAKLEPPLPEMPEEPAHRTSRSYLAKLASGQPTRLWLLAGGAVSVLIGVLPSVSRRRLSRRNKRAAVRSATVCL